MTCAAALTLASPAQPLIHAVLVTIVFVCVYSINQFWNGRGKEIPIVLGTIGVVGFLALLLTAPAILPAVLEFENMIRWIGAFPAVIGDASWVGATDSTSGLGQAMVLGETTVPINWSPTPVTARPIITGFGSMHVGGCHFLMGDGAVRFLSQNIDQNTLRQLSRIADGAVIGEF